MAGIGENYFPAFVLALSGSQLASGLTVSVPVVLGALLQISALMFLVRMRSFRRWVVLCAALQALAFAPLALAAWRGKLPVAAQFAAIAWYWGTGMAAGAAWSVWMTTLVPERCRARYFAWRTRIVQCGMLTGFVVGGLALQWGSAAGHTRLAFTLLFLAALASRCAAVGCVSLQSEPCQPDPDSHIPRRDEVANFLFHGQTGKVFVYLLAVQAAVQIAGPYFTPYMLRQLHCSYVQFVLLSVAAYVGKIVCLPALGHIADRLGPQRLLWLGGIAIIPCAALWLVSDALPYLLVLQLAAGAAWGAYELAQLLLAFEALPQRNRIGFLMLYNAANATAILIGSLLGGGVLALYGENRDGYGALFVLSTLARCFAVFVLVGLPAGLLTPWRGSRRRAHDRPLRMAVVRVNAPAPHFLPKPAEGAGEIQPETTSPREALHEGRPGRAAGIGTLNLP